MRGAKITNGYLVFSRWNKVSVEEAEEYLIKTFPLFLEEYVVKKEVIGDYIFCHVDWQGVFGSAFFTIILKDLCKSTKKPER